MIVDTIQNYDRYTAIDDRIAAALKLIVEKGIDLDRDYVSAPDASGVYYSVTTYTSKVPSATRFETHNVYMDIQFVAEGSEYIGYCADNTKLQLQTAYDEEKDITFYSGEGQNVLLETGTFMIIFPQEAHRPCIAVESPTPVKKVVFKIPFSNIEHLTL